MANSRSGETVVSRVVRIIEAFGARQPMLTISALARAVDLPLSTTHRLVAELVDGGFLERDESRRIRLGRRLWELASRGSSEAGLAERALPYMEDVHAVVQQHTTLGVLDHDEVLYLTRLSSHSKTRNIATVAGRLPVHACSSGLVLLAHSALDYQDYVLSLELTRYTDQTITDPVLLRRKLAEIRTLGYASVPGIIIPESTGIAVPVFERGHRAIAALNVIVRRGEEELNSTVPALKTAARGISRALGDVA
jgi:DNA-binding IclR family transcriptional regulator